MCNLKPCPNPTTEQVERDGKLKRLISATAGCGALCGVHRVDRILGAFDVLSFFLLDSLPRAECYVKPNLNTLVRSSQSH